MPTKLTFYNRDPNGLGRGPGLYYLRGGKRTPYKIVRKDSANKKPKGYSGGAYYSKYTESIDKARKSKGYDVHPVGVPKNVAKNYAHLTDGKLNRKR